MWRISIESNNGWIFFIFCSVLFVFQLSWQLNSKIWYSSFWGPFDFFVFFSVIFLLILFSLLVSLGIQTHLKRFEYVWVKLIFEVRLNFLVFAYLFNFQGWLIKRITELCLRSNHVLIVSDANILYNVITWIIFIDILECKLRFENTLKIRQDFGKKLPCISWLWTILQVSIKKIWWIIIYINQSLCETSDIILCLEAYLFHWRKSCHI